MATPKSLRGIISCTIGFPAHEKRPNTQMTSPVPFFLEHLSGRISNDGAAACYVAPLREAMEYGLWTALSCRRSARVVRWKCPLPCLSLGSTFLRGSFVERPSVTAHSSVTVRKYIPAHKDSCQVPRSFPCTTVLGTKGYPKTINIVPKSARAHAHKHTDTHTLSRRVQIPEHHPSPSSHHRHP